MGEGIHTVARGAASHVEGRGASRVTRYARIDPVHGFPSAMKERVPSHPTTPGSAASRPGTVAGTGVVIGITERLAAVGSDEGPVPCRRGNGFLAAPAAAVPPG